MFENVYKLIFNYWLDASVYWNIFRTRSEREESKEQERARVKIESEHCSVLSVAVSTNKKSFIRREFELSAIIYSNMFLTMRSNKSFDKCLWYVLCYNIEHRT